MTLGILAGIYGLLGVGHALVVLGLAAHVRRSGWPVWTRPTAAAWILNVLGWPIILLTSACWGLSRGGWYNGGDER